MTKAPEGGTTTSIDLATYIDEQPVGRPQIIVLVLCGAVLFFDGFDTQAIGYVAPAISADWDLAPGALGPVFSAGLLGLMAGALALGPLADRIGRRRIVLGSLVAFAVLSLATAFASGITSLLVLRFLTGLGLGGAMPNLIALASEVSPRRRRATMVMAIFGGFSLGAAIGWESVFVLGGVLPLLVVPVVLRALPESPRAFALSGRPDAVLPLLCRLFGDAAPAASTRVEVHEPAPPELPVLHLFRERRGVVTLLLWVVFFMSLLDLYFMANWLPSLFEELDTSVSPVLLGSLLQVGGLFGVLLLGRVIDRYGFHALAVTYVVAAVAIAAVGQTAESVLLAASTIFVAGFCIVGAQISSNALAATFYPTAIRSTGVGWALGIGRVGSIVGPFVGGVLIAARWRTDEVFLLAAVPALVAAAGALALGRLAGSRAAEANR